MKAYIVLLTFAVFSFTNAINCPAPPDLPVIQIDYEKLLGDWIMLANKPEWDEKCKNITVKNTTNSGHRIHEEYFKKSLRFWRKHSMKDYDVVKHLQPSPILELKNRAWYSRECAIPCRRCGGLGTRSLRVIAIDYQKYVVLYHCHKELFFISEIVEIWGRPHVDITFEKVPKKIRDVLAKFKISAADLRYRKPEDC